MPKQWLMKSEPESFSIADLERAKVEPWTGVRSHFAKLHMRAMQVGDEVLFYHSSCNPPGVAGLGRVARIGVVDETQFDPESPYYEPRATRERPVWDCVDVAYTKTLPYYVGLPRLRAEPALADMMVLRRGMRLSVQPVSSTEYTRIVAMGHEPAPVAVEPAIAAKPSRVAAPGARPARSAKRGAVAPAKAAGRAKPAKLPTRAPNARRRG